MSNYDGSAESIDLRNFSLTSNGIDTPGPSDDQLVASWTVDGTIPVPGSTCNPSLGGPGCPDLPDNTFVGGGLKILFQNALRQNNTPTNPVGGGCERVPTGNVFDQHGHWVDGFHFFIGFDVSWDGTKWIHSAQIGTYDPSPDGGFFFTELGVKTGASPWRSSDPAMSFGTNWNVVVSGSTVTVTVDGVVGNADINCRTGYFATVYAKNRDWITNVKGLSTAEKTVTLPVTIPLSLTAWNNDITSVGGVAALVDITAGHSVNSGLGGTTLEANGLGVRENVSYTGSGYGGSALSGIIRFGWGGYWEIDEDSSVHVWVYRELSYAAPPNGSSDTFGESPACPTPTFGGLLPANPFLNPAVGCHYDDDNIPVPNPTNPAGRWTAFNPGERGTFLSEWWDTIYGFTA